MSEDQRIKTFNEALSTITAIIEVFTSSEEVFVNFLENVDGETIKNLLLTSKLCEAMLTTIADFKIERAIDKVEEDGGDVIAELLREFDRMGCNPIAITWGMKEDESQED